MAANTKQYSESCSVVGCNNTATNPPGTRFYRFPNASFIHKYKQERLDKWITALRRQNSDGSIWKPNERSRICSRHFVGNEKSENPLSPSYNPSIFPTIYNKRTVFAQSAAERFDRAIKRRMTKSGEPSSSSNSQNLALQKFPQNYIPEGFKKQIADTKRREVVVKREDEGLGKTDQGTQVYFLDENMSNEEKNSRTFTCNRYLYIDASTKTYLTADAEVQVYLPDPARNVRILIKKPKTAHKCSGTKHVTYTDKGVGPDVDDLKTEGELKCTGGFHGRGSIKNDEEMLDLAGVTIPTFQLLMRILSAFKEIEVSNENRLLICLFKLKCGLTYSALSVLFGVDRKAITTIFLTTVQYLAGACKDFVFWPCREVVQATIPPIFQETYNNCRVIIDCIEFRAEQPSDVESRVKLYSHYEKTYTVKILVGCTPSGAFSFVSRCFGGRTTDAQITRSSGFLDLLEPNDLILADKRFSQIQTQFHESGRNIVVVIPPSLYSTFSTEEANETHGGTSVSIHIERMMQRLKIYRILEKFTSTMLPHSDHIVFMCCVLVNLQPIIMKDSDEE